MDARGPERERVRHELDRGEFRRRRHAMRVEESGREPGRFGFEYRLRAGVLRHVGSPLVFGLHRGFGEIGDEARHRRVEAHDVEHAGVVRIRDRETGRGHAHHDELCGDAGPLAVGAQGFVRVDGARPRFVIRVDDERVDLEPVLEREEHRERAIRPLERKALRAFHQRTQPVRRLHSKVDETIREGEDANVVFRVHVRHRHRDRCRTRRESGHARHLAATHRARHVETHEHARAARLDVFESKVERILERVDDVCDRRPLRRAARAVARTIGFERSERRDRMNARLAQARAVVESRADDLRRLGHGREQAHARHGRQIAKHRRQRHRFEQRFPHRRFAQPFGRQRFAR